MSVHATVVSSVPRRRTHPQALACRALDSGRTLPSDNFYGVTSLSYSERDRLSAALDEIAATADINTNGACLMRYTMNAVFHLPAEDMVLRIAPVGHISTVRQTAAVAAQLAVLDLPTVRLAPGFTEPIASRAWAATAWTYLPQPAGYRHQLVDLTTPLLSLHAVGNLGLSLPQWDVVGRCERRMQEAMSATPPAMTYLAAWTKRELHLPLDEVADRLLRRCAEMRRTLATARWTIPIGVIHGDAHAGNLLNAQNGVVLIDLDSISTGPREWDLVPAAHGVERFSDPREQYDDFVAAYGFDLLASPNWPVLRDVRELQLVTSVIAYLPGRPDVADELGHRLRSFLAGDNATWHRYR
jgi:aminoglycoside phosphotransferase (APT) family kinase protein